MTHLSLVADERSEVVQPRPVTYPGPIPLDVFALSTIPPEVGAILIAEDQFADELDGGHPAFIAVSAHLDPGPDRDRPVAVCWAHHDLGHGRQLDPVAWRREQASAQLHAAAYMVKLNDPRRLVAV